MRTNARCCERPERRHRGQCRSGAVVSELAKTATCSLSESVAPRSTTAEFKVDGAPTAIAAASCHLPGEEQNAALATQLAAQAQPVACIENPRRPQHSDAGHKLCRIAERSKKLSHGRNQDEPPHADGPPHADCGGVRRPGRRENSIRRRHQDRSSLRCRCGGSDIVARIIAPRLQDKLGQSGVVETGPAPAAVGNEAVANSAKRRLPSGPDRGQIITPIMNQERALRASSRSTGIGQIAGRRPLIVVRPEYRTRTQVAGSRGQAEPGKIVFQDGPSAQPSICRREVQAGRRRDMRTRRTMHLAGRSQACSAEHRCACRHDGQP